MEFAYKQEDPAVPVSGFSAPFQKIAPEQGETREGASGRRGRDGPMGRAHCMGRNGGAGDWEDHCSEHLAFTESTTIALVTSPCPISTLSGREAKHVPGFLNVSLQPEPRISGAL